jgi:hypothetical protein
MSPLNKRIPAPRIDARLAAYATLAGVALVAPAVANADVIYSGVQNISVPATFNGIYLNMITGDTGGTPAATPGWDVNPWVTSAGTASAAWRFFPNGNGTNPDNGVLVSSGTAIINLALGTLIGPSGTYSISSASVPPLGTSIFGIRLFNEATNTTHYGWIRMILNGTGTAITPGTIVDWAFESTPNTAIAAGAIPEPSTTALLAAMAAGAVGLRAWRKRKAAKAA